MSEAKSQISIICFLFNSTLRQPIQSTPFFATLNIVFLQVIAFDGGEYVSMAGEFNEFRKVDPHYHYYLFVSML